jgi:hypothetical protein
MFSKIVKDMEVNFQLTTKQKADFGCLQAARAQDFLLAITIDGLGQHISLVEYRIILKYCQMIPLFSIDGVCPVCRKACRELSNFRYRYDLVRDVLLIFLSAQKYQKKGSTRRDHLHLGQSMFWCMAGWEETCMCRFDWSFSTCGIDD